MTALSQGRYFFIACKGNKSSILPNDLIRIVHLQPHGLLNDDFLGKINIEYKKKVMHLRCRGERLSAAR
jgi:hypothetical protein